MKKNHISRITSLCLAFIVAVGMIIIPSTIDVSADSGPSGTFKYAKKVTVMAETDGTMYGAKMGSRLKGAKSVSITSSNSKVVEAREYDKYTKDRIWFTAKKPGSATLTVKAEKSSGTKTYKIKVKVIKYSNPFKSFKIGKKNITSKFKRTEAVNYRNKQTGSQRITVKMKPDWKIKRIEFYTNNEETDDAVAKTIKSGKKVNLHGDSDKYHESFVIYIYNTKTKVTGVAYLGLNG